jgi:hypothetical protein
MEGKGKTMARKMKDPRELTPKVQKTLTPTGQAAASAHSYAKVPALPQPPTQISMKKKDLKNTTAVSKGWNPAAAQTATCCSHLESKASPDSPLEPERVKRWKSPASVAHKIKRPASEASELPGNISVVGSSDKEKTRHEEEKQDELWRDLMKNQEERQFRIGRITNFFS